MIDWVCSNLFYVIMLWLAAIVCICLMNYRFWKCIGKEIYNEVEDVGEPQT